MRHRRCDSASWKGEPSITLVAGERDATFLPGVRDALRVAAAPRRRVRRVAAHARAVPSTARMTAVPFVHPWGNRLERREYRVGRRRVDLRGPRPARPTPTACPMHGNLRGAPFDVVRAEAGARGARLVARLDYGARPDLLRAFPFPHVVTIDARLDERGLRLTTEIEPTGRTAVPISFCWHPVRAGARRAAPRLGAALAAMRAAARRRARDPDRRARRRSRPSARPSPTAPSTTTTRSAPTAASRSRAGGRARRAALRPDVSRSRSSTCPRAATSPRSSR